MPSARAPSTSSSGRVAHHRGLLRHGPRRRSSAARKIEGLGFTFPCAPEEIQASTSRSKWRTKASRSRLVFETSPILRPCRAELGERRQRVVVELEVLVLAPSPRVISRAISRTFGPVAAHAADDVLREAHPDLLVVVELRDASGCRGRPRRGPRDSAPESSSSPWRARRLLVPGPAEERPRLGEGEVDVEEDRPDGRRGRHTRRRPAVRVGPPVRERGKLTPDALEVGRDRARPR